MCRGELHIFNHKVGAFAGGKSLLRGLGVILRSFNRSLVLDDKIASLHNGFAHYSLLPFYYLPLPTVDVGLNSNHRQYQEAQRVYCEKLNALGQAGEENAKEEQGREQNPSSNTNPPKPSVRGAVVLLIGLAGIVVGLFILRHTIIRFTQPAPRLSRPRPSFLWPR